jgi:hypothetical protein
MSLCRPSVLGATIAALLVVRSFSADLPFARLDSIFPPGGKAGTEVEATVTGAELDGAKALRFSHPGITATPKDKRFVIKIGPDVPPGIYDVRACGTPGISNPRAFVVSDLPQAVEPATNTTAATAMDVPLDTVVAGTAKAGVADWFKFTARRGQRVLIDCDAAELDSRLSPVLAVFDANTRELETSRRGGLLDFTAPADATYLLQVHDLAFAGTGDYFYRLTLTTGPRIDYIFPPCARPGMKAKFTLFGRNLPGGSPANLAGHDGKPLDKLDVEIAVPTAADLRADGLLNPAAAALDGFSFRLKEPHVSNPVFIGFTDAAVVAEHEPNNTPEQTQKLTPPCEVAGQFFGAGDVDTFSFDAKKGDVWWIEVISQRIDLPTNPFLLIERDAAVVQEVAGPATDVGGLRFSTASADPLVRFEAKEDGTYRLRLRDLFGASRKDPRNVYRLALRKDAPDFRLVAIAEPPPEKKDDRAAAPRAAVIRADGTAAIKVLALRRDGFNGDIDLQVEGLPPGAKTLPTRIPAGGNEGLLLISAAEKPEAWAGGIRVIGKAKLGDAEVTREARGGAVRWTVIDANTDSIRPRLTRDIGLGISPEPAPVSIAAAEEKCWDVAAGGKVAIPLKVTRRGEFKEALKLKAAGAPALDAMKEIDVPANATTATATFDLSTAKLPPGEHTIHFSAQTKGKFRGKDAITTIYSAPIRIAVQPTSAK